MTVRKLLAVLALSVGAGPLPAQVVRGIVTESGSAIRLPAVLVTLLDSTGAEVPRVTGRTDVDGNFALYAPKVGTYKVRAARIGYTPSISQTVKLGLTDIVRVAMSLSAVAQEVAPIAILEQRPLIIAELDGKDGFEYRRARFEGTGEGRFLDRQEIGGLGSIRDIIGTGKAFGARLEKRPNELTRIPELCYDRKDPLAPTRSRLPVCPEPPDSSLTLMVPGCAIDEVPIMVIDARRVNTWDEFENRVDMSQVAGIEIYRKNRILGTAVGSAPVESSPTSRNRSPCAVIMVWTRIWFAAMDSSARATLARGR